MNALRHAASLIAIVTLLDLGCQRSDQAEKKRIRIALPQWFSPSDKDPWLEQAWQTIREQNPGWTVDLETVPGKTEQVLQKLLVVRTSGEGPDLACVRLESMPVLVEQGILQPMQGTVLISGLKKRLRNCSRRVRYAKVAVTIPL